MDILGLFILSAGLIMAGFLWRNPFRKRDGTDGFFAAEAKRCLNHSCEIPPEGWSSRRRIFRKWLSLILDPNTGKLRLVRKIKLVDIGILR